MGTPSEAAGDWEQWLQEGQVYDMRGDVRGLFMAAWQPVTTRLQVALALVPRALPSETAAAVARLIQAVPLPYRLPLIEAHLVQVVC